jgi:hypothetical protein
MMKVKYIGKSFDEEVESLVGTLINLPLDYIRYNTAPYILHFDSNQEAQDAFVQLKHFIFSCNQTEPVLDGLDIEFIQRPYVPPSKPYMRERDAYIAKLFKDQIRNMERMLKADERVYRRRGTVFHFGDAGGVSTAMACLTLDPTPTSPFGYGMLDFVQIDPLKIQITCRKDVPYG